MTDGAPPPAPSTAEDVLGGRVRDLRQARRWSQEDLAQRMQKAGFNWFQSTVAKTEVASRPVRVGEAAALADLFDMTVDELIRPGVHPLVTRVQKLLSFRKTAEDRANDQRQELERTQRYLATADGQLAALRLLADYLSGDVTFIAAATQVVTQFNGGDEWKTILAEAGMERAALDDVDAKVKAKFEEDPSLVLNHAGDTKSLMNEIGRLTAEFLEEPDPPPRIILDLQAIPEPISTMGRIQELVERAMDLINEQEQRAIDAATQAEEEGAPSRPSSAPE